MKKQLDLFFTALMFYTRIPCPKWVGHQPDYLNQSTRYFPLIGWIVGGIAAGSYWLLAQIMPTDLAILLSMALSIYATGAFHEDGFADVCDGFGGGWTIEQRLTIMKDSRLGTYGSTGLIFMLATKFILLSHLSAYNLPVILIATHAISRFGPVLTIFRSVYVRQDLDSKAKPIGQKIKIYEFIIAFVFAAAPLLWLGYEAILSIGAVLIVEGIARNYFKRRLGGYTGDCLGAIQQLAEVAVYLSLLMILTHL